VQARRLADPLLGDVIEAMGYDTLVLDACRMIEALKTADLKPCKPIALSALRARCETSVAALTGKPALCPVNATAGRSVSRDPTCLARASRDERLCAAAGAADRPACAALVLGDPKRCMGNTVCVRQVARWQTLIEKPAEHRAFPAQARVDMRGLDKTTASAIPSFELTDTARQGAVVRRIGGGRTKVTIGSAPTPATALTYATAEPSLFLEMVVSPADLGKGDHPLGPSQITMDLLVPKLSKQSFATVANAKLTSCSIGAETGSPLKLALSATLYQAPNTYSVQIEIETFVRDLIGERDPAPGSE
jgi:hypothetical protein